MKKNVLKKLFSSLFFVAVFVLTFWYVFHDENLNRVLFFLGTARMCYIIPAVAFVIAFILGESVVIHYLLRKLGNRVSFFHCSLFSFIGFFYSAITPSASGGQPMQIVAMRKDGISVPAATVVLGIVTITYKLVLVLLGCAVLLFRPDGIMKYLDDVEPLMYLGLGLNLAFISFLLMLIFSPGLVRTCGRWIFSLIHRIRPFSDPEAVNSRLEKVISDYSGTASFFRNNPRIIVHVFFITLIQRLCLFSVVWFTYLAFGLHRESPIVIIMLYATISVAVDMLPLPGGMGISETLFLSIYEPIFGEALVLPGMMICRGISYYTQLLISAIMTGAAQLILRPKKK